MRAHGYQHRSPMPPERTVVQRFEALSRANEIRGYRARLKKDLKAGRVRVIDLLTADPIEELVTMKIVDLLIAVPTLGRVRANEVLRRCRISPSKTLDGLSGRQRGELVGHLRERPARPPLFDPDEPRRGKRRARTQLPVPARAVRSGPPASKREEA